jgi:tetratricopeptide (TPR) repeat protein
MKTKLILICVLILLMFSCSTAPPTITEGAKLFKSQQYAQAIKVFEKVLEKDPENANAAYNIAISYIQLKDEDNALVYLEKTLNINKLYYNAWYNRAVIHFNRGEYKKCIKSAIKGGKKSEDILEKAYGKLVEQGFPYRNYAQIKKEPVYPVPDFEINFDQFTYVVAIRSDGKVDKLYSCTGKKELCDFYTPIFSELEFIPGYNFYSNQFENSVVIAFVRVTKEGVVKVEFIGNEIYENSNNNTTMGSLDRSQIDEYILNNLAKIRWCYERELKENSLLQGRIVINFIITGSGSVSLSKTLNSTMDNENVEKCIAHQIKKIDFPPPRGGGIVIVNYPFVFRSTKK